MNYFDEENEDFDQYMILDMDLNPVLQ
jgi:hypothetical protein